MSMLAERRQRQKQTLNPRGKWWTEDSNKFGQRMLEKMGWTKGKGLGVNEQGITECTKVTYKNDTAGMGYDNNSDIWMEHKEKFNDFLQQFQNNQDIKKLENQNNSPSGQSVELKSKNHARLRYQKFIRSKDTNKYKSKDLANIFGKNVNGSPMVKADKDDNIYEQEIIGTRDNKHGIVTINGGNMSDYFKSKLNYDSRLYFKNKSNFDKSLSNDTINNETVVSEHKNEQNISFESLSKVENALPHYRLSKDPDEKSNYAFDNPCLGMDISTEIISNDSLKRSTKKRKKFESDSSYIAEIDEHNTQKKLKTEIINSNGFINPALNLDIKSEEDCNGKEFEVSRAQFGLENCGLDLTDEKNDKKRVTFNDHVMLYEYNKDSIKRKKGKATLDKFEVENKKQKKKRKLEIIISIPNGIVNEALDLDICDEVNDNELNEHKSRKIKKKKICKMTNLETIQESPEREKEIKIESEDILDINVVENGETDNIHKKLKIKKKKSKIECVNVIDEELAEIEIIYDENVKREKKSKEDTTILKKCKAEKKKDKKRSKNKKHVIQVEINNDEQYCEILNKSSSEQQSNFIENENKDEVKIETSQVIRTKENEEEILEKTKQKKKKRNSINKEDCSKNEIDCAFDVEKEVSDKENAEKENLDTKKLTKKSKKCKRSKDKDPSDSGDYSNSNIETVDTIVVKQEQIENIELTDTSSNKDKVVDTIDSVICSPWNTKRISKKTLISYFHNKAILEFPGSNIRDIKGYGCEY